MVWNDAAGLPCVYLSILDIVGAFDLILNHAKNQTFPTKEESFGILMLKFEVLP